MDYRADFTPKTCLAEKYWVKGFFARHPTWSVRSSKNTSGVQAMGLNKIAVLKSNSFCNDIVIKYKLTPDKIFNCDEIALWINLKR